MIIVILAIREGAARRRPRLDHRLVMGNVLLILGAALLRAAGLHGRQRFDATAAG